MRKQSGFTLIELMVVMAIIAILATAGISAYGGYIKKARDSTRISDIHAIESVVLASLTTNGNAPDLAGIVAGIRAMNNDILIEDPLVNRAVCLDGSEGDAYCLYAYAPCKDGGYILRTKFESLSNIVRYANDGLSPTSAVNLQSPDDFDVGSCSAIVDDLEPVQIIQ